MPFEFRVAGTGYERRYSAIRRYAQLRAEVRLLPEPSNPVDKHAIGVHMLWHNAAQREMWEHIGYVPAELAPIVGDLISSGEWAIEKLFVRNLDTAPELDAPRLVVRIEGKDLRHPQE